MAIIKVKSAGVDDSTNLGRRNLWYNGAVSVAQRGTSITTTTTGDYTLDGFRLNGMVEDWTVTQETDAPAGFTHSFKAVPLTTITPSGSDYNTWDIRIEGQDLQHLEFGTANVKKITLSFWVKSNVTGQYCVNFYKNASGGTVERQRNEPYTIDSANTWEKKTITIIGDTDHAIGNTNAEGFRLQFFQLVGTTYGGGTTGVWDDWNSGANFGAGQLVNVASSTSNYWQITGIQLEVGDTATPFEHRSYSDYLTACQRYYQDCGRWHVQGYGYSTNTDGSGSSMMWATTMRTAPTMTKSNTTDGGSFADMAFNNITAYGCSPEAYSTNGSYGQWYIADVVANAEM